MALNFYSLYYHIKSFCCLNELLINEEGFPRFQQPNPKRWCLPFKVWFPIYAVPRETWDWRNKQVEREFPAFRSKRGEGRPSGGRPQFLHGFSRKFLIHLPLKIARIFVKSASSVCFKEHSVTSDFKIYNVNITWKLLEIFFLINRAKQPHVVETCANGMRDFT